MATRLLAGGMASPVLATSGWGWYLGGLAEASVTRTDAIPTQVSIDASGEQHAGEHMNLLLVGRAPVTAPPAVPHDGTSAVADRTADDTSCIA